MKKIFIAAAAAIVMVLTFTTALAQMSFEIGEITAVKNDAGEWYLTDVDGNVISGVFAEMSDYDGYPMGIRADGSNVLFDTDGSVICDLSAQDSPISPANGLYAIMRGVAWGEDYYSCTAFELYDYNTRELLCTLDRPILYYNEQQTDKMVIENDEGKFAFINKYGVLQSDYVYDEVKKHFNPDYVPYPKAYAIVVQDGVEKYIDWDLNEIDLDNYGGEPFITNCYYVKNEAHDYNTNYYVMENGDREGLYDIQNERYIIPLQSEYKISRVDNNTYIRVKRGDFFGALDMDGNIVVPLEYSYLYYVRDDIYTYETKQSKGILKAGKKVFEGSFISIDIYDNGLLGLFTHRVDKSMSTEACYSIVNYAGHRMTNETYTHLGYKDGVFYVSNEYHADTPTYTELEVPTDFAVINLNGKYLDVDGVIRNDRTLAPVREIIESLGGEVTWNEENGSIGVVIGETEISLEIGSDVMMINNEKIALDCSTQIINEKTMIPVRAIAEAIGAEVYWDGFIRCVYINR